VAVAFDALGPSSAGQQSATTSISWTHTAGGGGNIVLVWLNAGLTAGTAFGSFTSVTYGGSAMTLLKSQESGGTGANDGGIYCYGITGATGGANTVSATYSSSTGLQQIIGFSVSFTGGSAFATSTIGTSSNAFTTSGSVSATATTSGGLVCAGVGDGSGGETLTAGTQQWKLDVNGTSGAGNTLGATSASSGGTVTFTWTQTGDAYGAIAVEVLPAAVPPPPLQTRPGRTWRRRFSPPPGRQKPPVPYPLPPVNALAGVAAASGVANQAGLPFLTQVLGSGSGQYFADQFGRPYMVKWDSLWGLIANAGNSGGATTYQSDMDGYCAARAAQGFNGFLVTTTNTTVTGPNANGNTWDGVAPFSSPGVLNNTFWTRVDYLVSTAAAKGLTVVINLAYTYAVFNTGGCLNGWTALQFQNYGAAVGARYATQQNVIWEVGDDYGGSWVGGLNAFDTQFSSLLTGLRGAGGNQLVSVENESEGGSRYSQDGVVTFAWGVANAQFEWVYSYNAAYSAVEDAYTDPAAHSAADICVVKMDGWYDNQWGANTPTESVELFGRKWIWWSLSSGSRGAMYGNGDLYTWPVNALSSGLVSATPGSSYVKPAALNTAWSSFASLAGWHQLVPDTSSALVTAGRGTRVTAFGNGAGSFSSSTMYVGGNTYVTASRTPDSGSGSSLAVIYIPASATITIDQTKIVAGYTATWIDPANGATSAATPGSTFNSASNGANSAGDHDWVLVLGPAVPSPGVTANAGVAAASGVAMAPAVAVTVTAGVATAAAAAPQPVPAITVPAGVAAGSAAAPAASVTTSAGTSAPAAVAAATAVALAPSIAITATAAAAASAAVALQPASAAAVTAGPASATAAAPAATAALAAQPGAASATATALAPVPALTATAGAAAVTAIAPAAGVSTSGNTNAPAAVAASTAAALSPLAAVTVRAGVAAVAGTAPAAAASQGTTVTAGVAAASAVSLAAVLAATASAQAARLLALGLDVPPKFTIGTLTASVAPGGAGGVLTASDVRLGGPA